MRTALSIGLFAIALSGFAAEVSRPAPDLTISLTDGKQLKLSDYRGKVVVFAFILTT